MAPNNFSTAPLIEQKSSDALEFRNKVGKVPGPEYERVLVWRNIILFVMLHFAAVLGLYAAITSASIYTSMYAYVLYFLGGLGITAGAHRLWAHKSYSARLPLRVFLMFCNTLAFQNSIYEWSRDHRVHHKYSETNADPHNANRGFFFAHVGWLLCKKHPDVIAKGKQIDMSDLEKDSVVVFQRKYYLILMPLVCFIVPTFVPVYLWNETLWNSFYVATLFRYAFTLNVTWLVNSAAHFYGNKPYDKFINPAENLAVAIGALGEGWHNYHHTFPWDYKTAELGNYKANFTTAFIDFMARIGQAYKLRTVSTDLIMKRVQRTGDGSHPAGPVIQEHSHEGELWGWGDKDMSEDEKLLAKTVN